MSMSLELVRMLLEWSADIAWPLTVVLIVFVFRQPLLGLLAQVEVVAKRAETDSFDLQLGQNLKLSFRKALEIASPDTVEDAIQIAEREADKAISILEILGRIPLKQHHKDLLLKIAKGDEAGIVWQYGGEASKAPGRTMGYLLENSLVFNEDDRYFAHPLVREYIRSVHPQPSSHQKMRPLS